MTLIEGIKEIGGLAVAVAGLIGGGMWWKGRQMRAEARKSELSNEKEEYAFKKQQLEDEREENKRLRGQVADLQKLSTIQQEEIHQLRSEVEGLRRDLKNFMEAKVFDDIEEKLKQSTPPQA